MRFVPERSALAHVATVFACFLLAPATGIAIARIFTPDSNVMNAVAPFAYFTVFFVGILLWVGLGVATLLFTMVRAFLTGTGRSLPSLSQGRLVPPGYRVFLILGGIVGSGLGTLAVLLAPGYAVGAPFLLAGVGYGATLWYAAHHGYLPFPEED